MYKFSRSVSLALFSLILSACSSHSTHEMVKEKISPNTLYTDAKVAMEAGNFPKAIRSLETLDSRFPFGPYKVQAQLDLIYAYYKTDDAASGLATIDRFIRLNPTHPDIDYVFYMRGLVNMQADSYLFHDIFNIDRSDRDPKFAQNAFNDFNRLIQAYPNSKYAADAQKRMFALKNRLAQYALGVAEYYLKMNAWSAAAIRAQSTLETHPDTFATKRALEIMIEAYDKLGQEQLKQNALMVMQANFPNNDNIVN